MQETIVWLETSKDTHPEEVSADRVALIDCLERLGKSSWFEWLDGSRMHFWKWPECWMKEARDGARSWQFEKAHRRLGWPSMPQEDWMEAVEAEKLTKLIKRQYLEEGDVEVVIPRMWYGI